MVNWVAVFVGFVIAVVLSSWLGSIFPTWGYWIGFVIAGLLVGYWVDNGTLNGLWNSTVSGAFGAIVVSILAIIGLTLNSGFSGFLQGVAVGISAILIALIINLFLMGIAGAIGAAIAGKRT
jgi:Family of unknown function (DUF5518)